MKLVYAIVRNDNEDDVVSLLNQNHYSVTRPVSYTHLDVYKRQGYERIAVVTHGGLIRVMAAYYTGIPLSRFRILGKDLENCSITELQWDEKNERFTLECFNDHAHLDKYPELLRSGWKG